MSRFGVIMDFMQDAMELIAGRVRGLAAERRLTQERLAELLGLERKAIGARLSGSVGFTAAEMWTLSNVFDVPIADLYPPPLAA